MNETLTLGKKLTEANKLLSSLETSLKSFQAYCKTSPDRKKLLDYLALLHKIRTEPQTVERIGQGTWQEDPLLVRTIQTMRENDPKLYQLLLKAVQQSPTTSSSLLTYLAQELSKDSPDYQKITTYLNQLSTINQTLSEKIRNQLRFLTGAYEPFLRSAYNQIASWERQQPNDPNWIDTLIKQLETIFFILKGRILYQGETITDEELLKDLVKNDKIRQLYHYRSFQKFMQTLLVKLQQSNEQTWSEFIKRIYPQLDKLSQYALEQYGTTEFKSIVKQARMKKFGQDLALWEKLLQQEVDKLNDLSHQSQQVVQPAVRELTKLVKHAIKESLGKQRYAKAKAMDIAKKARDAEEKRLHKPLSDFLKALKKISKVAQKEYHKALEAYKDQKNTYLLWLQETERLLRDTPLAPLPAGQIETSLNHRIAWQNYLTKLIDHENPALWWRALQQLEQNGKKTAPIIDALAFEEQELRKKTTDFSIIITNVTRVIETLRKITPQNLPSRRAA